MMETKCAQYVVFLMCIVLAASSEVTNSTREEAGVPSETCGQEATWNVYMDFVTEAIKKAKNSSVTCDDAEGECGQKEALMTYLNVVEDMMKKARVNFPTCNSCNQSQQISNQVVRENQQVARDCSDLLRMGHKKSGVYTISPINRVTSNKAIEVYCDMETDGGGWTVVQRRGEFQNPTDYFFKDWKSYKEGFGSVDKEFWLGNDNIFALTNQGAYSARFDLEDVEKNKAYAKYESFYIDDESNKYALHLSQYSGDAGDSMETHNNQKFTTKDLDNDTWRDGNCAQLSTGAWWFNACYDAHFNGINIKGKQSKPGNGKVWKHWKGSNESLLSTEIKVRPKNFKA